MTGAAQIDVWTPKSESYCSRDAEEKKKKKGNDTLWRSLCGHRRAKANAEETQIKKKGRRNDRLCESLSSDITK